MGRTARTDFPTLRNGRLRGDMPDDPDELVVYIHGWMPALTGPAADQANAVANALDTAGHDATVVGFQYPANLPVWHSSKRIAARKGRELGEWLVDFAADSPDTDVRIVTHSLGARVGLACLDAVREQGESIRSVALLAAAVGCDTVTEGGRWYGGVRDGADEVHNYHLDREVTLELIYQPAEFGTRALGVRGACGTPPENYTEHDVTESVSNHYTYLKEDGGCLDEVVADFS